MVHQGFAGGSAVKNPPANAGHVRDTGSIPRPGRSPGRRNGNPLQYCCLENPMDRGAWRATVHGATKGWTQQATEHTLSGRESTCQCRRHGFDPWVGKIPWRRKWQPTPVFLPGESDGQRSLAGYSPRGHKESETMTASEQQRHVTTLALRITGRLYLLTTFIRSPLPPPPALDNHKSHLFL